MSTLIYKLQKQAVDLLNEVLISSHGLRETVQDPARIQTANLSLIGGLETLQTSLQEAFAKLPNGQKIFIPELETVVQFARDNNIDPDYMLQNVETNDAGYVTTLDFPGGQCTSIRAIAALTSMRFLNLIDNQIEDITALTDLTKIESLNLDDNEISDISPLVKLRELEQLGINGNRVKDISVVAYFQKLKRLEIQKNPIGDMSPIISCGSLEDLDIDYHDTTGDRSYFRNDLSFLDSLGNLKAVLISGMPDEVNRDPIVSQLRAKNIQVTIDDIS